MFLNKTWTITNVSNYHWFVNLEPVSFPFQVVKRMCWLKSLLSVATPSGSWSPRHTETCMAGYDRNTWCFYYFFLSCLLCSFSPSLRSLTATTSLSDSWLVQQVGTQLAHWLLIPPMISRCIIPTAEALSATQS